MDLIETLLTRGVDTIYPTKEELEKLLRSDKKLTIYQGFDPTGTQLHIGHLIGLRKLEQWRSLGHHVIFLIGDFTGMIGDPSGKTEVRKMLDKEEVVQNAEKYKEQAGKILSFEGENPVEIKYNSEWLSTMSAIEFFRLSRNLTYNQVIERDMFQERNKHGLDIYMNEFLYPFMQAYDSVAMDVDVEIGGTDQMFNMMLGRKLMRNIKQKEKFVMTTPLFTDSQGRKIGKTEGNVIALNDVPSDLFAKIMGLGDDVIVKGLEYVTDVPIAEVQEIATKLKDGENPVPFKKLLAFEVVKQLNTEEDAKDAQENFESVVQGKKHPSEIPPASYSEHDQSLADALITLLLVESKAEAKRVIEQGGVSINDAKITDPNEKVDLQNDDIVKVGKRRIVKIQKT